MTQLIPARLLRPQAEDCRNRPETTDRDRKRRDYILEAAQNMFIQFGRGAVTLPEFCYATGLSPVSVRRSMSDMDHLFAQILTRYLDTVMQEVLRIPQNAPNHLAQRRAAYFSATRGICNIPTPLHFLLLCDRFSLPPDELEEIEKSRRIIGSMLSNEHLDATLALLDCPTLQLHQIEPMLDAMRAAVAPKFEAIKPEPAESPPPEPPQPRPFVLARRDAPDLNAEWKPVKIPGIPAEMAEMRDSELRPKPRIGGMKPFPQAPGSNGAPISTENKIIKLRRAERGGITRRPPPEGRK